MARKDFLEYAASYSGVDGGDIGAEYWFVGMEWSNDKDIIDDYQDDVWKERTRDKIDEDIDIKDWPLENAMDELYQILPNHVSQKKIFQKNSNSFKLNLLPLPFGNTGKHDEWIRKKEHKYTKMTGCKYFDEYMREVLPLRYKLFQKLLQEGKKPKTIFCFGKDYKDEFLYALTGNKNMREDKIIPLKHSTTSAFVYNINNELIKKIIVCYFPTRFGFNDCDWTQILNEAVK